MSQEGRHEVALKPDTVEASKKVPFLGGQTEGRIWQRSAVVSPVTPGAGLHGLSAVVAAGKAVEGTTALWLQ